MHTRTFLLALTLNAALALSAVAQGPMVAAPSGRGLTEVTLTLVDSVARAAAKPSLIRIDYGQPHLRGRAMFTDSLVPYDKVWRLGANDATTLTTDVDLMIGGEKVPKGTWVLQAMPARSGWTLLVQKNGGQSPMPAATASTPANDNVRIPLKQTTLATPLESFTMWLIPSRDAGVPHGELRLAWGSVLLSTTWSLK